jgi:iron(III) transport system ATP-binding protein
LSIRGLCKSFGGFAALRDISLDVEEGEFVCFLGPSGCGKTTLLRAIAGLVHQDGGEIRQAGRDISGLPVHKRDFGIVFQSYALFPNLTVKGNVAYGLEAEGRLDARGRSQRVAELLTLVGLAGAEDKFPAQLSGGEQQRVALARALATSPSLLLLDEPLSALDARVRVRLRDEIKSLQRRLGVTTIMVTHDQEEALAMADRIVVMNQGVIEQVGTPSEIYRKPATAFVADFVGSMTFLDAGIADGNTLRLGSLSLRFGGAAHRFAEDAMVRVGFRPEEIQVRNVSESTVNRIVARVMGLDFLGSFCRAKLKPQSVPEITILADFSANLMRDLGVAEGQDLAIALPPESLHVFAKV